ncbi:integrase DNA-binding domain-containing protein, partial [Clostridioides difficile]|uniref:integrase DNA-binding domain-containing protein n=2 Tax=Clostridia TaxID=186801 RepID=UPI003AA91278
MLVAYHGSFLDGKELYTMSKMKRQDSKGRNLRLGESQRKDGRYVYKYTDIFGKPQFVY